MSQSDSDVDARAVANFIFEMGQLREKSRSGWELIRIPEKERVSSHVLRMTQLAYVLAVMEGYPDPNHVAMCALFHENDETRLPDIHRLSARYITAPNKAMVVHEQTMSLGRLGEGIFAFYEEANVHTSPAGIISKDADLLECAFTAKEYMEQGHVFAQGWIANAGKAIKTTSASRLFQQMLTMTSNDWWQDLKKLS